MSEKLANIIIALLSIAVFVVMILFVALPSFSYYQEQKQSSGVITVGEANFEFINDLPLFSNLQNFHGGQIDERVQVINARDKSGVDTTNLVDCYLRFKVDTVDLVNPSINTENFISSEDGYYYYKGIFSVGQTLDLIDYFVVSNDITSEYIDGINVSVTVDTMQATKNMIIDVFPTAPVDWINILP